MQKHKHHSAPDRKHTKQYPPGVATIKVGKFHNQREAVLIMNNQGYEISQLAESYPHHV